MFKQNTSTARLQVESGHEKLEVCSLKSFSAPKALVLPTLTQEKVKTVGEAEAGLGKIATKTRPHGDRVMDVWKD